MPVTAIIVGAGHRALIYALYAKQAPDKLRIVGVADPDAGRREMCKKLFDIPDSMCFESADALAAVPKCADAVINGTMDNQHVDTAVPLLKAGYDMLLEKPFAIHEDEMWRLVNTAKEYNRRVMICHVLRYAPFYVEIKKRLPQLGRIMAIETTEHVSHHRPQGLPPPRGTLPRGPHRHRGGGHPGEPSAGGGPTLRRHPHRISGRSADPGHP